MYRLPIEQQVPQTLNFSVDKSLMLIQEYLTILQQDGIQDAFFEDATKAMKFFKKTGIPLPLNNSTLDLLKNFLEWISKLAYS